MTLYIVFVCVLALLSITLVQEKVIPWPLENLGLMGAFFSILSLQLALALRARLTKYYLACSFILMIVGLLGFFILEVKYVNTAKEAVNQPNFHYITGWSTTKEGDDIIRYFKDRDRQNPDLGNGPENLPDIYNGFWTICWLYRLVYVLMLSGFVLAVGGIPEPIDTDISVPTSQEPIAVDAPTAPTPVKEADKEVFISYAWGGESEDVANELEQAFKDRGVTIVRDKRDLGFKGRIKEFMESIGRGKCVILVISDKYLKSANCMFELIQVSRHGNFAERIFPVLLADARIYDPLDRISYVEYWERRRDDLDAAMKRVSAANLHGFREDID